MNIGIVVIATNAYFPLGIKFIKRLHHFYTGDDNIRFYFFSDTDPKDYTPDNFNIKYIHTEHAYWVHATNSKFTNILSLNDEPVDYLFYFDADTSVNDTFEASWFLGDLVGGEHYGNRGWMKDEKPFDRNPLSKAYVPKDTNLPQMYYYGAFFGGRKDKLLDLCSVLQEWQQEDKKLPYEPCWNDESYLNKYFHYHPPKAILNEDFPFYVSDKSGIQNTRDTKLDVLGIKEELKWAKDLLVDIRDGRVITP
tara:strand:- start:757 stop:1509 length:753 start_codon:yes stop_codon:yes gene_type:complete